MQSHVEAAKTKTGQQNDTGEKRDFINTTNFTVVVILESSYKRVLPNTCFKLFVVVFCKRAFFCFVFFLVFTRIRMCFYWEKKKSSTLLLISL